MKTRIYPAVVSLVITSLISPTVIADDATTSAAKTSVNAEFVDPDSSAAAEVRRVGDNAINRLANTMVNELNVAMAKSSLEDAVDVTHLKNLPMTGDRLAVLPQIKAVKRTSLRLRNPANAPDAADQLALERVEKALAANYDPPKVLVQRIDTPGAAPEWRVYRPLGAAPLCLKCHGDPAEQSVALRTKLNTAYPADQAIGFRLGEWRGLLRVTVDLTPPPAPKPTPKPVAIPAAKKN